MRESFVIGPMTAGFFSVAPVGEFLVWLWLLVASEITVVILLCRDYRDQPAAVVLDDAPVLHLLRRVVPHLRARRPLPVVEAQLRWRQAAAARRSRAS